MEPFSRAERRACRRSFAAAPPDLLPSGWQGEDSPPLEIDVGCHKGRFLVEMAQRCPTSNFLGVERQRERVEKAKKKIALHGLGNAEILQGDGLEIIQRLPDACADFVHVLFPDPWPKRRHRTRRMVGGIFLNEVLRVLKIHGLVRLVTDDLEYARAIEFCAGRVPAYQRAANDCREYPPSEFQIKFLTDSRPVYQLTFARLN